MSVNPFKPLVRQQAKARIAVAGPSGSGKSRDALVWATQLAGEGKRIAVLDTEHRAHFYADTFPNADVLEARNPTVQAFIDAMAEAERHGYEVLVIDSFTDAWVAVLNTASTEATGWGAARPLEKRMWRSFYQSPLHIICTVQTQNDTIMVENERGKLVPTKVGMKAAHSKGVEYRFTHWVELNQDHSGRVVTTRSEEVIPAGDWTRDELEEFGSRMFSFLNAGEELEVPLSVAFRQGLDQLTDEEKGLLRAQAPGLNAIIDLFGDRLRDLPALLAELRAALPLPSLEDAALAEFKSLEPRERNAVIGQAGITITSETEMGVELADAEEIAAMLVAVFGERACDLKAIAREVLVEVADEDLPAELREAPENAAGPEKTATTEVK